MSDWTMSRFASKDDMIRELLAENSHLLSAVREILDQASVSNGRETILSHEWVKERCRKALAQTKGSEK